MRSLLRVIRYLRPYRRMAYATLLAAVLATVMDLIPPWLIKIVIDDVISAGDLSLLKWVIAALVGAYFMKNALNAMRIRFNNNLEQKVIYDMRDEVYRAIQGLSFDYFDNHSTGEVMSRVNNDVSSLERVFIDGVEAIVIAALTILGVSAVLFVVNWQLALLALVPIPFLSLGALFFTRRVHRLYHRLRQKLAALNTILQDNISGIREILAYNRQGHEQKRFNARSGEYCQTQLKVARLWSLYSPGMLFIASMGSVLILSFGVRQVVQGSMTLGELVAFLTYLTLFYIPINQIHSVNHMLQHALAAGDRVFELMDTQAQVQEHPEAVASFSSTGRSQVEGRVEFRHVHFRYRPDIPILQDVNFEVQPGEKVALTGASGNGKSTMMKLLMRFYDVDDGMVTLDGLDIRRLKLSALRDQIALVQQEPFMFNGTVRENIVYGNLTASEEQMMTAAQTAGAREFIQDLPEGYDTWIGERGVKLSVGQKQRIAIARALIKDPPIIIMDEATSSVDTATESRIQEALEHLIRGRTTFIIAHRLSTLKLVDRILVIQDGRLVESGTHEELFRHNGLYTTLFEAQFQD